MQQCNKGKIHQYKTGQDTPYCNIATCNMQQDAPISSF